MQKYIDIDPKHAPQVTIDQGPYSSAHGTLTKISVSTDGKIYHTIDTSEDPDNPVYVTGKIIGEYRNVRI